MEMVYSVDQARPIDEAAERAVRADGQVKIRVQPALLQADGRYALWPGVSWTIGCAGAQEAIQVREALRVCFEVIGREGAAAVQAKLGAAPEAIR